MGIQNLPAALQSVIQQNYLERAFEERSQLLGWVRWDPAFDAMRSDERFEALIQRLVLATTG